MAFNSGTNPDVVHTKLDDILYTEYDYADLPHIATAETSELFKQSETDKLKWHIEEFSEVGLWEEHDEEETRTLSTVRTANEKTVSIAAYKKTLAIPVEFYEDDQHEVVQHAVTDMGRKGRLTRDEKALDVYAGGFATFKTADAAYLWSDSHTNLNGDTIDNLETAALTASSLETLVKSLWEQKGQDSTLGGHRPRAFLLPPILFPDALEITKSELKQGTTDNDLNYFSTIYPGLQLFSSPLVGSTYHSYTNANTSHYLVSRNHSIVRKVRLPMSTDLVPFNYDDQDRYKYKGRYREKTEPVSWTGAVASSGSA